jgi:hypothetical protein
MAQAKRPALALLPDEQKQQRSTDEETAPKKKNKKQKFFLIPEKLAQAMERVRERERALLCDEGGTPPALVRNQMQMLRRRGDHHKRERGFTRHYTRLSLSLFLVCKSCNQRPSLFNAMEI